MVKWHKGPPPYVGWWPASMRGDENMLRWWDGFGWSCCVHKRERKEQEILRLAAKPAVEVDCHISWTERPASWPERSKA